MSGTIYLSVSGLIYTIITTIIFIKKRKINKIENRIYKRLLFATILSMLSELSIVLTVNIPVLSMFVQKFYLIFIVIWLTCFTTYAFVVTKFDDNISDEENKVKYNYLYKLMILINIILSILIMILPIYFNDIDGSKFTSGPSVNTVFIAIGLHLTIIFILLITSLKNTIKKGYLPIVVLLFLFICTAIIQKINPELLLMNFNFGIIIWIMFNTIENPDLKLINELNLARDRADKANQAKTEFLSNMSHEIRTPLNAIVGFSNSLLENVQNPKAKEDANYIIEASKNLLEIVNGILDISKIEANKIEIINKEYDMEEVLDNLVALSKARLGNDKPIEFRSSFDKSIPKYLYGDATRFKQICVNLLTNSIKYTNEGFIEFKIDSVIKGDVVRLIISVEDSGIGIKKEDVDKLFEKFGRLDIERNKSIEGSGLGLAITKKLVEMMGGTIVVQSEYGKGSKFTVALDQKIIDTPTKKDDFDILSIVKQEYPGKKILVIDDNKLNLKVAEKVLEPFQVIVETALSGDEGIEKIKTNSYDLILLDDMMPNKTGTQTLEELKSTIPDYNTPTIALTANAISGMKEKYLNSGFDDYLAKPIEKDELKRILNKFLK